MAALCPMLMFQGQAEDAMLAYAALFPDGAVLELVHHGPDAGAAAGLVLRGRVRAGGQVLLCMDSPITHDFGFTPSLSLFVTCESEAELRALAAALGDGGEVLMPLDTYGFSQLFCWLNDRFGVSWQLNLP